MTHINPLFHDLIGILLPPDLWLSWCAFSITRYAGILRVGDLSYVAWGRVHRVLDSLQPPIRQGHPVLPCHRACSVLALRGLEAGLALRVLHPVLEGVGLGGPQLPGGRGLLRTPQNSSSLSITGPSQRAATAPIMLDSPRAEVNDFGKQCIYKISFQGSIVLSHWMSPNNPWKILAIISPIAHSVKISAVFSRVSITE